ncbi:GatB/YqeY [Candidatus Saccharibacteria bacterium 47-87]|nr:GatB/YqeY domain-containing protein [Candidatus Saccharibacteria bacterium]OJU96757.1 MAG: GatB/YqeY [Candidatus Saccharibacteria bacterium 47-87]
MALKSQIDNDVKAALLGGDRFRADVLRGLKAVILNEEVAKGKRDEGLDDATIEQLIAREVKKRLDSVQQYTAAARPELAETEQAEAKILEAYLPEQLSEADVQKLIDETIAELGVSGPQAMGQVIGAVKAKVGNSADGATIARLVKEAL